MGFDKIAILGHSYGAVVAQLYAIKYGENLTHLIIADGFFNGKMWQENDDNSNRIYAENMPEVWDSLMVLRAKGLRSSDKAHFEVYFNLRSGLLYSYNPENAKKFPDDQSYANDFNRHVYYQIVGADGDFKVGNDIALFDVTKQLKDLKMPILIIAGRFDRVSVPRYAVQYKKYCPQARFVMFENSGHSPQVEEPEKEFALIREFMES
jgi:proline iminopeptidase